jgi:hypothetical protein
MSGELKTPRRMEALEAVRLLRLARQCPHRVPGPCVCCPSWCRRFDCEVSGRDCIECLKKINSGSG